MAGRGSAPGERRGGRQKGTPNWATAAREAAIAESGKTPLDFMLSVLRDEDASIKERMWAAVAAAPYCHAKPRPVAANAGGRTVNVEIRRFSEESEEQALLQIDRDARAMQGEDAQAQPEGDAIDRLEAEWFKPDSQHVAHEPALPPHLRPAPPPPQPPALALVAAPVPHENRPVHRAKGNGTSTTQPQRVNGASRPRPGNGAVVRRSDEEIRNINDRRPMPSGYPRTRPVHGVV